MYAYQHSLKRVYKIILTKKERKAMIFKILILGFYWDFKLLNIGCS